MLNTLNPIDPAHLAPQASQKSKIVLPIAKTRMLVLVNPSATSLLRIYHGDTESFMASLVCEHVVAPITRQVFYRARIERQQSNHHFVKKSIVNGITSVRSIKPIQLGRLPMRSLAIGRQNRREHGLACLIQFLQCNERRQQSAPRKTPSAATKKPVEQALR